MPKASHKLKAKKPVPVVHKPLKAEYKEFFKALGKGVLHSAIGKWEELGSDAIDAMGAVGLTTEPEELAHQLIDRSLKLAVVQLVRDSYSHLSPDAKDDSDELSEIEDHCRASGLGSLLDVFQEGAKAGVTRLLAAFFFKQYGQRPSGDPTFVFTHKSFGEYLTARRVVRAMERIIKELERRAASPDEGWDEREALKQWAIITGPSAITHYLRSFLLNELRLRLVEEVAQWQQCLANLFSYMLLHGMPMEQLRLATFQAALFQSRNAEEALLVSLNACALTTKQLVRSSILRGRLLVRGLSVFKDSASR